MTIKNIITAAAFVGFSCAAVLLSAVDVGTADYTGSRSFDSNQLDANYSRAQIDWTITDSGSSFNYFYEIRPSIGNADSEEFYLELDPSITSSNFSSIISNILVDGSTLPTVTGPSTLTTSLGDPIYGMRLDFSTTQDPITVEFDSTAGPVWGDFQFYRNMTNPRYAENTGFGTDPTGSTTDFIPWVPTVGALAVPEPSTYLLLAASLGFIALLRRRQATTSA